MQYLVKIFIFSSLLLCATQLRAQVTSVQYAILFNSSTNLLDCYIYIEKGEASDLRERIQFNAQYSLIIPTNAEVSIAASYMPLINNQNFKGKQPLKWEITNMLQSPEAYPAFDFYGITPNLAPTGLYNELFCGDLVKIFSLNIEGNNIDYSKVRLYDNTVDPKSNDLGMMNGDFSNGFTLGGYHQLYNGIKSIDQAEVNYISLEHKK